MKILRLLATGVLFALAIPSLPVYADDYIQEEFSQVYDLAAGGTVSVKNVNGSVTLNAWDRPGVQVQAIKKGRSKSDMDEVKIDISPSPQRLAIQTIHPKRNHGDGVSVSYTLLVPRNVILDRIETVN